MLLLKSEFAHDFPICKSALSGASFYQILNRYNPKQSAKQFKNMPNQQRLNAPRHNPAAALLDDGENSADIAA